MQLILGRVEERQLSERDKGVVFDVINRVRRNEGLSGDQELLAHFFAKLVSIHEAQRKAEIPIRQFVKVCNKYLQRKELKYDDANFQLPLVLDSGHKIEMRHLSSGEKQIVSLFAHVYLGVADRFFVIIDEPELSLSVEWQRTLLSDLLESQRCEFLAAVTHSPFIYEGSLETHTMDLARFIKAVFDAVWTDYFHLDFADPRFTVWRARRKELLDKFSQALMPLLAVAIALKRKGANVNFDNVKLADAFNFDGAGAITRRSRSWKPYLTGDLAANVGGKRDLGLREITGEMARMSALAWCRGKFFLWAFLKLLERAKDDLGRKGGLPKRAVIKVSFAEETAVEVLSARCPVPPALQAFIQPRARRLLKIVGA